MIGASDRVGLTRSWSKLMIWSASHVSDHLIRDDHALGSGRLVGAPLPMISGDRTRTKQSMAATSSALRPMWAALGVFVVLAAPAAASPEDQVKHHALSLIGEPKYRADFKHFDWVNPDAPKGGTVRFTFEGTFDSLN